MNLHEYYRSHKEAINTSIMEIACDLAVGRLLSAHDAPFETFVEADDPDDPDGGTHYKEEFQKEYDTYYDEEYARVAKADEIRLLPRRRSRGFARRYEHLNHILI